MRLRLPVVLLLIGLASPMIAQSPVEPEPYPGQRSHQKPPDGLFCSPKAKDKAHECHCKRMAHATPADPVCEDQDPPEDPTCTVNCHKDSCLCATCEKTH